MAELINSIILPSGNIAYIPVYPVRNVSTEDYVIDSRTYNPLIHYSLSILKYKPFTDEDYLILCQLMWGIERVSSFAHEVPQTSGQWAACWAWVYGISDNEYTLIHDFKYDSTTHVGGFFLENFQSGSYVNRHFFNSENVSYSDWERNFYETITHWNGTTHNNCLYNLREGPYYTLDIATRGRSPRLNGTITQSSLLQHIVDYNEAHPNAQVQITAWDPSSNTDPYIVDDPSTFGGGGGSHEDPDEIEKATIPPLPSVSAVDTGLVTLYSATNAQLQALGGYLWANWWDIETNFKKVFSNPMDCLIGLSIIPVIPNVGGGQAVKFGNIDTNVYMNTLTSQYVEVDCGTLSIKEYVGSFLDYSPYVNISLYLPYIGYRELSPDDVMNDTIHVVYHIDVLSGGCCAMIETGNKGLLYSFNGSCITNVPITAINYSGAIQNAVSAVGAGLTTVAGIATGAAPVAAVGAVSMLSSAANTAMNSKPTIQRSGSMGGSAGLMSYQKPLLVITRPRMSVPDKLNKFVGLTTNVTMKLSQVKGFTQVEHVHLSGIAATQEEKDELMTLLRQGVIF